MTSLWRISHVIIDVSRQQADAFEVCFSYVQKEKTGFQGGGWGGGGGCLKIFFILGGAMFWPKLICILGFLNTFQKDSTPKNEIRITYSFDKAMLVLDILIL